MCSCGQGGLGQLQGTASEDFMLEVVEIGQGEGQRVQVPACVPRKASQMFSERAAGPFTCGICYNSSRCQRESNSPGAKQ